MRPPLDALVTWRSRLADEARQALPPSRRRSSRAGVAPPRGRDPPPRLGADLLGGQARRGARGAVIATRSSRHGSSTRALQPWCRSPPPPERLRPRALDLDPLADVAKVVATTTRSRRSSSAAALGSARAGLRLDLRRPARPRLARRPLLYRDGFDVLSRYAVPLLPVVVLYGFAALGRLAGSPAGARASRRAPRLAAALAALVLVQNGIVLARVVRPHTHSFSRGVEGCLGELGRWCAAHTGAGSTVAIADIGAFGYYSGRRVLDLAGLISPELVPLVNEHPIDEIAGGLLFAGVARPDYLVDRHPEAERLAGEMAGTFEPLRSCRIEGLGVGPAPTLPLYRLHWDRYDAWRRPERHPRLPRLGLRPGSSVAFSSSRSGSARSYPRRQARSRFRHSLRAGRMAGPRRARHPGRDQRGPPVTDRALHRPPLGLEVGDASTFLGGIAGGAAGTGFAPVVGVSPGPRWLLHRRRRRELRHRRRAAESLRAGWGAFLGRSRGGDCSRSAW
jgi:hypothetical protein